MQSSREWDRIETEFELHGECKSVIHIYKLCNYHTAPSGGDLRLARGTLTSTSYTSGRLEIYLSGQWETVCNDLWDSTNSDVACRQLGYFRAARPTSYRTSSSAG